MQKTELLNNITHEQLKVQAKFTAELGDNLVSTIAFLPEFSEVQKEYPILCRKDSETGAYQAVVFFGFQKGENLFLTKVDPDNQKHLGWRAEYVPAVIARGPFSIGIQRENVNGTEKQNAVIHVDMSHPKVNTDDGEALFLKNGGHSQYLNYVSKVLDTINEGMLVTELMFDAFNKYELLEPVSFDIEFQNQEKLTINGFETINIDKLFQLNGEALEELNKSGFLQAAYFIATSLSNIRKLINWKNHKILANRGTN